jgi:acyl transferase domain-containing protein
MYTRQGSFLEQVDMFDAAFFGIAPREAVSIDPQQRLLLEVSWEALEHAGLPPHKLKGSRTGVFIGISGNDYAHLLLRNSSDPDAYLGTGNANSIAANRLSYMFDFRGPSLAIDTACSSSLVALHTACESLRLHQCDMALAGGVSLMLLPEVAVSLCRARMLAADGRCKTFDAAADGYGRGEGAGIVVLKRLSNALRHQDPILALVRGSAINHDGRSSGLTAPNGLAQQAVMRAALSYANVSPGSIGYVEAHGTGTPLGDPVEIDSLKAVLSEERAVGQGCAIGSVKTNIGHLEAAAGIAGFIKTVLALQNEAIPAHLHLRELNPYISLEQTELSIPITHSPWPRSAGRRLAGVSSFGFGGTNCHVVLEEAPASQAAQPGNLPRDARPLHLLALSARSELALRALARKYAALLAQDDAPALVDCCYTANCGRSHFNQRLVVTGAVAAQVGEELDAFARGHPTVHLRKSYVHCSQPPGIVFLFSGQGAQFIDMGRQLYETHPTFRAIIEHCDTLLRPVLKRSLVDVLYPAPGARSPLNETQYTQPALFTLEYALARLLQSWGIEPAALLGHSIGEYVAACVAGIFSLEDGLHLVSERGRLMQAMPHSGSMAAIFTSEARVAAELAHYSSTLSIAAINSTTETVISGESQAVQAVVASLSHEGISARFLNVSHAFHSHIMEPMLDQFEQAAARVTCYPPGMQLLSNLNGQPLPGDMPPPARYWRRHVREPVQFAAGIETLWQQGYRYFVEIGPHPTLLSLVRQCEPSSEATFLAVLHRGQQDWQQLFDAIGTLYLAGLNIEWERLDSDYDRCRVALPTYSFQRTRYWPGTVTTLAHPSSPHQPSGMAESQQPADNTNRFARYRMLVARPDERQTMLTDYLVQLIAHVLKVPAASLDAQQPISELLIIDSLMAAELRHRIETDLSIAVSLSVFYQEVSIAQLAGMLLQQDSFAVITPVHARYLLSIIDALSYQQAASLLARLRDV